MKKATVIELLARVKAVREEFQQVRRTHEADLAPIIRRLVMEAAVNFMSPEEIAEVSGYTIKSVRFMLRAEGLDPRMKKPMLSKHSARTLAENAALLNLDERDLLMSPLAYLPAGDALRKKVQESTVSKVTEVGFDIFSWLAENSWEDPHGDVVSVEDLKRAMTEANA